MESPQVVAVDPVEVPEGLAVGDQRLQKLVYDGGRGARRLRRQLGCLRRGLGWRWGPVVSVGSGCVVVVGADSGAGAAVSG